MLEAMIPCASPWRAGYAQLIAWIGEHAPGPRSVVSIEGTRSYGAGLSRAITAAGPVVIECEQPHRQARRGKDKSDPIDAHLAVLTALPRLRHVQQRRATSYGNAGTTVASSQPNLCHDIVLARNTAGRRPGANTTVVGVSGR
jgi:hypothetical protein